MIGIEGLSVRKPSDITLTPYRSSGIILLFSLTKGFSWIPNIIGRFGPCMSASSTPTFLPDFASAMAIFVLAVDLPTPPLPDAMAIMSFIFCSVLNETVNSTFFAPISFNLFVIVSY